MKAPFTYFGGKRKIANIVWQHLGNPEHYLEPFFGSGAVLLARPGFTGDRRFTETVCDADGYIANVWRGIRLYPKEVAKWCDWPVNHADLNARRHELIRNESQLLENLCADPEWCDPKLAGYWIWAACSWIGGGMLGNKDQIPHIGTRGKGVHGVNFNFDVFEKLSKRLRHVRVVCGDFMRILGGNWQDHEWKTVGIFFDPPYNTEREKGLYHVDNPDVTERVEKYCLEKGTRKNWRIIVCGYENEYRELVREGWQTYSWKTQGGYANQGKNRGRKNRKRETVFISPNCKRENQMGLFD